MRTELLSYLTTALASSTFKVSNELPWSAGIPLYLKNPRRVYVDLDQKSSNQVIAILGNHGVFEEEHAVSVYLATDAKNLPADYTSAIDLIRAGKDVASSEPYFRREVDTITSYEGDLMVTQLDFRFTKLT